MTSCLREESSFKLRGVLEGCYATSRGYSAHMAPMVWGVLKAFKGYLKAMNPKTLP